MTVLVDNVALFPPSSLSVGVFITFMDYTGVYTLTLSHSGHYMTLDERDVTPADVFKEEDWDLWDEDEQEERLIEAYRGWFFQSIRVGIGYD